MLPSKFPRLRSSWCGCPLQSGVKIIGFLSLFGNLIGGTWRGVEWYKYITWGDSTQNTSLERLYMFVVGATAVLSLTLVVCSTLLIGAAYNSVRLLMIPWLVVDAFMRVVLVCSMAHSICMAIDSSSDKSLPAQYLDDRLYRGLQIFFAVNSAFGIVFGLYLWWIVMSYFLELVDREKAVNNHRLATSSAMGLNLGAL